MPHSTSNGVLSPLIEHQSITAKRSHAMSTTPSSRSSSRGGPGARKAKLDLYTRKLPASLHIPHAASSEAVSLVGKSFRAAGVKRWDGNQRTTTDWDCLRRVRLNLGSEASPAGQMLTIPLPIRIPSYGIQVVIASCISMNVGNQGAAPRSGSRWQTSNPAIAGLYLSNAVLVPCSNHLHTAPPAAPPTEYIIQTPHQIWSTNSTFLLRLT